jgi:hypothetical protein
VHVHGGPATGDASNVSNLTAGDSIPEWRLVPHDNNIGQRNVSPVAGGSAERAGGRPRRSTDPASRTCTARPRRIICPAQLPKFLAERGWTTTFDNPGKRARSPSSRERSAHCPAVQARQEFTPQDVVRARADAVIHVTATADGIVGGMSHVLDARLTGSRPRSRSRPWEPGGKRYQPAAVPAKRRSGRKRGCRRR